MDDRSLVSPVTVNPASFAPPTPLSAICVHVAVEGISLVI